MRPTAIRGDRSDQNARAAPASVYHKAAADIQADMFLCRRFGFIGTKEGNSGNIGHCGDFSRFACPCVEDRRRAAGAILEKRSPCATKQAGAIPTLFPVPLCADAQKIFSGGRVVFRPYLTLFQAAYLARSAEAISAARRLLAHMRQDRRL